MKLAVIADIHSNIAALKAVLEDIKNRNVDLTICLGDLVGYCTYPNDVIDTIRRYNIPTIMGNYDDAVGNELMLCGCDYPNPKDAENAGISLNWTIDNVTDSNKRYLRKLPKEMILKFEGKTIVFVHGSPRQINEYLKENTKEADEVMSELQEDILVCGHTHIPYYKTYGDKMLINCGSAGKPKTGKPEANYVILEIEPSTNADVQIVNVTYDFETVAKAIEENGLPQKFADIIRTGRG